MSITLCFATTLKLSQSFIKLDNSFLSFHYSFLSLAKMISFSSCSINIESLL